MLFSEPEVNLHIRSSRPEVFLVKRVLKICSKFTGEHPSRSAICKATLLKSHFRMGALLQILAHDIFTKNLRIFAGNGNNELTERPCLDASFRQPYDLAIEFDNVASVTDAISTSLSMITTTNNTQKIYSGALYGVFSTHEEGGDINDAL